MMGCAGEVWTEGDFTLALFQGGVGVVKNCWNRRSSYFSFRKKFIIVFPFGVLVDNNKFLKMCVLKSYWLQ